MNGYKGKCKEQRFFNIIYEKISNEYQHKVADLLFEGLQSIGFDKAMDKSGHGKKYKK